MTPRVVRRWAWLGTLVIGAGLYLAVLAVLRDSPTYTDRIRLRDVLAGPFTSAGARPRAIGERDRTPGALALAL